MVHKSVFTKQQSQEQVNPDDEGEDDLNIADDVTQPMGLEQVVAEEDSEDEVDDDVADLEDRRMLDDFIDVTQYEKHMMHLWNSFIRKQQVLADAHAPWACEAFLDIQEEELVLNPKLNVAAIKKSKGSVDTRKHASETMKAFFSDPKNRLKRSISMKGVNFYSKNYRREGHMRHYCPEVDQTSDRRYKLKQ
ncbi:polycomb group protein embryonic flower 2-like protein, partial [Tanacetum coccineum]